MNDICTYLIRLHGHVEEDEINAVSPVHMALARVEPAATLFSASTDQSGLIGLLRHLHGLGLLLLSLDRVDVEG